MYFTDENDYIIRMIMERIKIFQPETYPKNIDHVRNEITNLLNNTKNS